MISYSDRIHSRTSNWKRCNRWSLEESRCGIPKFSLRGFGMGFHRTSFLLQQLNTTAHTQCFWLGNLAQDSDFFCWGLMRHSYWNFWLPERKQVFTINHIYRNTNHICRNLARLVWQNENAAFQAHKTTLSISSIGNILQAKFPGVIARINHASSPPRDSNVATSGLLCYFFPAE